MTDAQTGNGATEEIFQLDPVLYAPTPEEVAFLKKWTGIDDDEQLKQHVLSVQKGAWDIVHYRCIQTFGFLVLKISRLPRYQDLLELGKTRPDAIFIDYACCFGNDARKAITDGYPQQNVLASDLEQPFWELGHKLFKTTPESFPVPFVQGSVFDAAHISPVQPLYSPPSTPRPNLTSLTSLNPLQGHVSAIHVSAFFHLFGREQQIAAARALASLLSPEPGSMIFGVHSSRVVSGERVNPLRGTTIYDFNPEDWTALWDGEIFRKGSVKVEVELKDRQRRRVRQAEEQWIGHGSKQLVWCIKRL